MIFYKKGLFIFLMQLVKYMILRNIFVMICALMLVVLARRMGTLSTRRPRGAPNPRAMRGNGPQNPDPKPTRGSTRRTNSTHQAHAPISPLISSLSQLVHQLVLELAYPGGIP